jgi:hypothetical protein
MKRSGDPVIGRSGDLQDKLTAETTTPASQNRARRGPRVRSRGENQKPTTETRRHGEDHEGLLEICSPTTEQISTHGFCRAERDKKNRALAPELLDHPITCDHRITRSPLAPALFTKAIRTLLAALREIFDESAYDRFLLRTNAGRSIASYRAFSRERDVSMQKKPRCC